MGSLRGQRVKLGGPPLHLSLETDTVTPTYSRIRRHTPTDATGRYVDLITWLGDSAVEQMMD